MSIAEKLVRIESTKSSIEKVAPQKDWDDAFFRKIKVDFTYFTNKLEGSTLTYGQTVKFLKDFVTPQNANPGELLDMINHQKILDSVFINYRSQTLSEENIKELHGQLMKDIAQWSDDGLYNPGRYKSFENMTVRPTGKVHTYTPPGQVSEAMNKLVVETNQQLNNTDVKVLDKHPLTIATFFHQQFLNKIHPFSDGNGRIGRIFLNLILLKKGYPPIFIKEVNREEYLRRFELSDEDINPMLDFLADRLLESLEEKLVFVTSQH